ncbi:MAG TPA: class I SAM-dependent methyltransferase [Acetobacteraceae bacterium]|nr:class I SAM-dependent methyltransferase [Acetobacteraceae bacterium]
MTGEVSASGASSTHSFDYVGGELALFQHARNWKAYFARQLSPYIAGRVLDVGAGIGSNIECLINPNVREWVALEPDPQLAAEITRRSRAGTIPAHCRVVTGTLDAVTAGERFDAILYIDVLEHIDSDHAEVSKAADLLAPGGHLIVLAPAHQFLYSPFDKSIGHFRRYDMKGLRALTPAACHVARLFMLDSVGFLASLANRLILRSGMPTKAQIATWDRAMVPLSRLLDPLLGYRFGKSIVVVWQAQLPSSQLSVHQTKRSPAETV